MTRLPTRVLLIALLAGVGGNAHADSDWEYYNGSWYQLVDSNPLTFWQAQSYAESLGGHLATIHSAEENAFVNSVVTNTHPNPIPTMNPWIGLYQPPGSPEPDGGYVWVTGEPVTYLNWREGSPSNGLNGAEDTARFYPYGIYNNAPPGMWNDVPGTSSNHYIIEYSEGNGNSLFANDIYEPLTTEVGPGNNPNLILGLPDHVAATGAGLADFTSNSPSNPTHPYGRVTVSFGGVAVDRPGDDIAIHYGNYSVGEDFEVYVINNGIRTYLGANSGGNPANASTVASFDLASAGINQAQYVQIVNTTPHAPSGHEGVDIDAVEIMSAWSTPTQPPGTIQPPCDASSVDFGDSTSAVVYTHGWATPQEDFIYTDSNDTDWHEMQLYLHGQFDGTDTSVIGYDWTASNGSEELLPLPIIEQTYVVPSVAASRAISEGHRLGCSIVNSDVTSVHLVAHSAGAWLIDAAADYIESNRPEIDVQVTFLDAFNTQFLIGELGDTADYAEHYVDRSPEDIGRLDVVDPILAEAILDMAEDHPMRQHFETVLRDGIGSYVYETTGSILEHAMNVVVTDVDGSPGSHILAPTQLNANHNWPVKWYATTISSPGGSWGFNQSVITGSLPEYGTFVDGIELVQGGSVALVGDVGPTLPPISFNSSQALSLESLPSYLSSTDLIEFDGATTTLRTDSSTRSDIPVWITSLVTLDGNFDSLFFTTDFTSLEGAEGLLSVYLDGTLLGTVDERIAFEDGYEYFFGLPIATAAGEYELAFRLDSFSTVDSEVVISDIYFASLFDLIEGDLDRDGFVGVSDLDILLANWGDSVSNYDLLSGDWTGDGLVNEADLNVVLANWGNGTPPGGNVPEPGTFAGLAVLLLCTSRRRRR
ncbi:lectin-like protein [Phycisphaeraceae bacterium D3-23]